MVTAAAGPNQDPVVLARCPDCQSIGGCILGIRAAFEIPKSKCPATGVCRTKFYALTSPKPENNFHPPVDSYELKQPGAKTGDRIVVGASYCRFIRSHKTQPSGKYAKKKSRTPRKRPAVDNLPKPGTIITPPPPADPPTPTATSAVVNNAPPPPPPPPPADDNPSPEAHS
jgi:hypothetical protein